MSDLLPLPQPIVVVVPLVFEARWNNTYYDSNDGYGSYVDYSNYGGYSYGEYCDYASYNYGGYGGYGGCGYYSTTTSTEFPGHAICSVQSAGQGPQRPREHPQGGPTALSLALPPRWR
ncbi:unnamed protein product [Symbiodinium natans]|uniref:Uncharacterized protein n=1 Tax=Symbiodinium natans TaxID=878477 RepID=A0A812MRX4_9DINO|nr:unnamed protein product [Symbiodinium natans]